MLIISVYLLILLQLSPFGVAERKLSKSNCQCGVHLIQDNVTAIPWIVYVHHTTSPSNTRTCVGTVIASNIILTSRKCLESGSQSPTTPQKNNEGLPSHIDINNIAVTKSKLKDAGPSYVVVGIRGNSSEFAGIEVDYNFATKESQSQPVCIPTKDEPKLIVSSGSNVTILSAKSGAIHTLTVKIGRDCFLDSNNPQQRAGNLAKDILCVTVSDKSIELEVGQPLFIDVGKNPYRLYPFGFYTYLAGLSTLILEGQNGQKHLLFIPLTVHAIESIESLAKAQNTIWCSQPWPWLIAPGEIKRDESLDCECGRKMKSPQSGRIVGGEDALPYEFPWMVGLNNTILYEGGYIGGTRGCGASLINDRVILTAAHCIASLTLINDLSNGYNIQGSKQTYRALLHSHFFYNDSQQIDRDLTVTVVHPGFVDGFRKRRMEQDIALMILDEPLNFSDVGPDGKRLYSPICLPKWGQHIDVIGKEGIVAGWGFNSSDRSTFPGVLKKGTVTFDKFERCKEYAGLSFSPPATFCSMGTETYTIQGDSGGPVIIDDGKGKYTQVGVASWVADGRDENGNVKTYACIYADVQEFVPFLDYYSNLYKGKYCKA